ncbi:hypothetical protein LCGC14_1826190 [marine sediment metagenome]|uniref:Uncharacterized protein n=1 Tax=marine sediment metagenome TaxID=412755 RepID=A0A0F9JH11_9ZZZZ
MKLLQKKKDITLHILTIFIILVFFYSHPAAAANIYPSAGWHTSTPEEQGMNSKIIADMLEWIHVNNRDVHDFMPFIEDCK